MTAVDDLPPLRDVIREHGLSARKSLGQNFLLDLNITSKIARSAGDLSKSVVIEVGPGPGGLTRALLLNEARHVIAVERDERCLAALEEISAHYHGRLKIIAGEMSYDSGDIIMPKEPGEKRPAVLQIHGGGWVIGDKREQGLPLVTTPVTCAWRASSWNWPCRPGLTTARPTPPAPSVMKCQVG